jgi:hypothetical protein
VEFLQLIQIYMTKGDRPTLAQESENGFRTAGLASKQGKTAVLDLDIGFWKRFVLSVFDFPLTSRTWLIFSISAVFSTKDILASAVDSRPQSYPLLLTACQLTICAAAGYFLPSSRSAIRNKRDQFRLDVARLLLLAASIFFNYAYVDLSNSFIQIARVSRVVRVSDA